MSGFWGNLTVTVLVSAIKETTKIYNISPGEYFIYGGSLCVRLIDNFVTYVNLETMCVLNLHSSVKVRLLPKERVSIQIKENAVES